MNSIVLTGATSMLGVALIKECIKNQTNVLAIVRRNSINFHRIQDSTYVKIVECNLDELENLELPEDNYDVFYHFAWDYTDKKNRDNALYQNLNIKYTLNAVELAHKSGCSTFIGAGSQAEYGKVNDIIAPDTPINPDIAYGIAKYAAGRLSGLLCCDLGIKHIWTRVFSVYGPYDNQETMIMYSIRKLLNHEKPIYTKSEQLWDYLYCDDAARAFYLVGVKGKDKAVYCIGSGKVQQLSEYIYKIRDSIDISLPIGIGEKDYSKNQVMYLCADISNLIIDTGFQPIYSFDEGIHNSIEWFKKDNKNILRQNGGKYE